MLKVDWVEKRLVLVPNDSGSCRKEDSDELKVST